MTMEKLAESVNKFLEFNEYQILDDKWSISHSMAEQKAHTVYDEYNKNQSIESDFDRFVKEVEGKK